MEKWNFVDGKNCGEIKLYALSTCVHCRKTKEFLEKNNVSYYYIYVDLLEPDELDEIYSEVKKYNPRGSFPTIVINGTRVIVGSKLDEIRKVLDLND
ncbi:glutaredoxin [Methanoplanus sp. FWC-SCC4]|uniref:Glutaredoxin n=1 Tax=Methanochimaera problematica TaxID=2609417 RepID=A0AA97FCY7_9EURY|nr:glutaredoxin [Methanoplanus sp. FWC-SCC4]WOF15918.1 glutaredoxin [Methanoplanus sp. FWC-SCC4]